MLLSVVFVLPFSSESVLLRKDSHVVIQLRSRASCCSAFGLHCHSISNFVLLAWLSSYDLVLLSVLLVQSLDPISSVEKRLCSMMHCAACCMELYDVSGMMGAQVVGEGG